MSGPRLGNGDNDWTHSLIGLKDIKHLARKHPVHGSYYCYYELSVRKDFQPLEVSIDGARGRGEEVSPVPEVEELLAPECRLEFR